MVLEKRGTISEEDNSLFFSSFCMTKRKIFCPFYFYKMGRWRLRKANRHNLEAARGKGLYYAGGRAEKRSHRARLRLYAVAPLGKTDCAGAG